MPRVNSFAYFFVVRISCVFRECVFFLGVENFPAFPAALTARSKGNGSGPHSDKRGLGQSSAHIQFLTPFDPRRHSIPHTARAFATSVAKSSSLEKTALMPLDKAAFSMLML